MDVARDIGRKPAQKTEPKHSWGPGLLKPLLEEREISATELARKLVELELSRSGRHLSAANFAKEAKKMVNKVHSWTSGRVEHPRGQIMIDICRILGVEPNFFIRNVNPDDSKHFFSAGAKRNIATSYEFVPTSAPTIRQSAIPIRGRSMGGSGGALIFSDDDVVGMTDAPADIAGVPDAYAVYVIGDSMQPVFRPGHVLIVNPHLPPNPQDDVVIQITRDHGATVEGYTKRFLSMDDETVKVCQFNPEKTLTFPRSQVVAIHTVCYGKRR